MKKQFKVNKYEKTQKKNMMTKNVKEIVNNPQEPVLFTVEQYILLLVLHY